MNNSNIKYSTVESLMNALEMRIDSENNDDGGRKRSRKEKEMDEDIESMFRTKVRWDHIADR
jgi:hypothetical protein